MAGATSSDEQRIDISVSDQGEFGSLRDWVASGPDIRVSTVPGTPQPGHQGVLDTLVMLGGGTGLIAALRVLPDFIRSRRSSVSVTATVKGSEFTLTADNVEDVMKIVERLLDE